MNLEEITSQVVDLCYTVGQFIKTEQIKINSKDIEVKENYTFLHGDITDENYINSIFNTYKFDAVIHLAAESHVDRSIADPLIFAKTNILGTINLLNAFKSICKNNWNGKRFYHISTDEVYGSLGESGLFKETTAFNPNSPYAASKASSDHFVRAYHHTYGMPIVISNCSNTSLYKPPIDTTAPGTTKS